MEKRFYITTPIYYVNAEPHLGHAYTTILADVMRRFNHLKGAETYFVTGTDEHGDKVLQAAKVRGVDPKAYVDVISDSFRNTWPRLNISYDVFIRTTDPDHTRVVQYILRKVYESGDIYFGKYQGLYCTGCERFYAERELEDGLCPQHRVPPERREEENYFFRMSRYQQWLIQHIQDNPDFIRPERYRNETLSMLRDPLEDLCISRPRSRLDWGIPLPFDDNYVTYVWFDALINYLTAIGYPDGERFERFWPHVQHLIAKDILKPHGIYWPTMLKAAGVPLYQHLNVHGYWNVEESKMSKTLGNVIRPLDLVGKYGLDPFRYFLLREMVFGLDSNFSELALVQRLNSDLANDLGNLLQRSLTMGQRFLQGRVPLGGEPEKLDDDLQAKALETVDTYQRSMEELNFHKALVWIWELINQTNRYIDRTEPFRLAKDSTHRGRLETVMYCILEVNRLVALLIWPFMPQSAQKIAQQLGVALSWERGDLMKLARWGLLKPGSLMTKPKALFPRVDLKKAGFDAEGRDWSKAELAGWKKEGTMEAQTDNEITMDEFQRIDLRVAKVVAAEAVEGSDRLLNLRVEIGSEERQLIAGVARHYEPERLLGQMVVVVSNLKPAKIFGQLSQGMLLAAVLNDQLRLVTLDGPIETGAKVQ